MAKWSFLGPSYEGGFERVHVHGSLSPARLLEQASEWGRYFVDEGRRKVVSSCLSLASHMEDG